MSNQNNPIRKITIENFQSHKKTILTPAGKGQLTVIVGQSRQGKTAIFRALRWLFYNAPDGADFIRWGCTFARITVEYADGTQVIRYRTSGGTNRYIIQELGQKEQVYEGFGRGIVPLEVQQVTGVAPVEMGEGLTLSLNLAEQLDGPFLGNKSISSTGRAKVLGKLAGTEAIDTAGKILGTDLYRWKRSAETEEKLITETQDKLKAYEYLPKFKLRLDELIGIINKAKKNEEKRQLIDVIYREYVNVCFRIDEQKRAFLGLGKIVSMLAPLMKLIEENIETFNSASYIKEEWEANLTDILSAKKMIDKTSKASRVDDSLMAIKVQIGHTEKLREVMAQQFIVRRDLWEANRIIDNTRATCEVETVLNGAFKNADSLIKANAINGYWKTAMEGQGKINRTLKLTNKYHEADGVLFSASSLLEQKDKLALLYGVWERSEASIKQCEGQLIAAQAEATKYQGLYEDTLTKTGTCPLCGASAGKMNIKEVF